MFKYIFITALAFFLIACAKDQKEENDINNGGNIATMEGIIAEKMIFNSYRYLLLIVPNIEESDLQGKNEDEIIMIASENDGIYFLALQEDYNQVEEMQKVLVKYDLDGPVEESDPPIRELIEIHPVD